MNNEMEKTLFREDCYSHILYLRLVNNRAKHHYASPPGPHGNSVASQHVISEHSIDGHSTRETFIYNPAGMTASSDLLNRC